MRKITIEEVNRIIETNNIPYGQDIILSSDIDTSSCEEFFGTRCSYNIHVTSSRSAHKDRFDPRFKWKEHLDYDVRIPHQVITIGVPTITGATIGGLLNRNKPLKGLIIGGIFGFLVGLLIETIT
jgi:hypothetical protein